MSQLISSSLPVSLNDEDCDLTVEERRLAVDALEDINTTTEFKRRKLLGRRQRFYVRAVNAVRPGVLNDRQFHDIKESAIRLPANESSRTMIEHVFKALGFECAVENLSIRYDDDNQPIMIIFTLKTLA